MKEKLETVQTNNLTLRLQELEEQERQPRASRRKEITKIRAELNDIETKSTIVRINAVSLYTSDAADDQGHV